MTDDNESVVDESVGEIVLYTRADGKPALEVRLEDESLWVTQAQLVELFQTSRTNVVEHIGNIYDEGELDKSATCRNFRQVRQEGSRTVEREVPFYNLDVIISVGNRIKNKVATQFRIWATERLREYLITGFTMDDAKLVGSGNRSHKQAIDKAESEYEKFKKKLDSSPSAIETAYLQSVKEAQKKIEGKTK